MTSLIMSGSLILDLLRSVELQRLRHLVVAHVSENNNSRHLVEEALLSVLDGLESVVFADQSLGFDWLHLA